jgi:hypothetical protein
MRSVPPASWLRRLLVVPIHVARMVLASTIEFSTEISYFRIQNHHCTINDHHDSS